MKETLPPNQPQVDHSSSAISTAIDYTDAGAIHSQKSGAIVGCNQNLLTLLGYPSDFQINQHLLTDFCHSLDQSSWSSLLDQLTITPAIQFKALFYQYDGDLAEMSCLAVCEQGASIIDLYVYQESSDNHYLNDALARLEAYEAFFDTDLIDINIKDKNLHYIATSKRFEETFSLPSDYAIGKTPEDVFPKKFADHVSSHDNTVISGKEVVSQIDIVPFTGEHLLVQKFPIYRNNALHGLGVFAVDVTALRVNEQRHIASRDKYADYVEMSSDIFWEADQSWQIKESNISGTLSVCGISFKSDSNLLTELKRHIHKTSAVDHFVNALTPNKIHSQIFHFTTGKRVKLSVKPTTVTTDDNEFLIYRGSLTILVENQ